VQRVNTQRAGHTDHILSCLYMSNYLQDVTISCRLVYIGSSFDGRLSFCKSVHFANKRLSLSINVAWRLISQRKITQTHVHETKRVGIEINVILPIISNTSFSIFEATGRGNSIQNDKNTNKSTKITNRNCILKQQNTKSYKQLSVNFVFGFGRITLVK